METLHFHPFPPASSQAHIALFTSIPPSCLATLRQRIINASHLPPIDSPSSTPETEAQRESVNFAFLNPHLITSRLHLQTAIYQAILAESQNGLRTKTVHSEILWALNPTNNITEAIRRYGIPPNSGSDALLIVRVCGPDLSAADVQEKLSKVVEGKLVALDTLDDLTDWGTIKKYHKLNNEGWMRSIADVEEKQILDNIVTSTVAMKSVAT